MQARGQLWFELERVCRDFQDYAGLEEREALEVLTIVLNNMLTEQVTQLKKLTAQPRR